MDAEQLKSLQAPLKDKYREDPRAALITLRAEGRASGLACRVETGKALVEADSIPPRAAMAPLPARATCCSKHWSPAPA
jgi:hypothetical protein